MKFSIIVPIYNTQKYLKKCITSVIIQNFEDWELLLIDDGSTDQSGVIADEYAKKDFRIRVIHNANQGQFSARLCGLRLAKGDFVLFLDSDDYWHPSLLSLVQEMIDNYDADMVMFPFLTVAENNPKSRLLGDYSPNNLEVNKEVLYKEIISTYKYNALFSKAFKRELINDFKFEEGYFSGVCYGEDKVLTLPIITAAKKIVYLATPVYYYRKHNDSVMQQIQIDRIDKMITKGSFRIVYDYMHVWGLLGPENIESLATYYLKHVSNVFSKVRRSCDTAKKRKAMMNYRWEDTVSHEVRKYAFSKSLQFHEKVKLMALFFYIEICKRKHRYQEGAAKET